MNHQEPDCALGLVLALVLTLSALVAVCVSNPTPAERQRAVDAACPTRQPVVRYPAELGGSHPAVCNPTGEAWR